MAWFAGQDEVRTEVTAQKRQGRVSLRFNRFPFLRGDVRRNCLSVMAVHDGAYYDRIFDLDCLPLREPGQQSFICGFCEGERRVFDDRTQLYHDHLFEPFREWIVHKLQYSIGVEYGEVSGCTWAGLRMNDKVAVCEPFFGIDRADHLRLYKAATPTPDISNGKRI